MALKVYGCTREQLIGRAPYDLSPPSQADGQDSRAKARANIEKALAGVPQSFEWLYLRQDGTSFDAEVTLNAVTMNQRVYVQAIVRDISEHKRAEEALRLSQAQLLANLENTPNVAIRWYDEEGRIRYWNRASEAFYGWSAADVIGRTPDALMYSSEEVEAFLGVLESVRLSGEPYGPREASVRRRDGTQGWVLATVFAIPMGEGHSGFVCMEVDISERKRTEEALRYSDATLLSVFRVAPVGICIMKDRRYVSVNEYWTKSFGYQEETLVGKSTRILYENDEEYERVGRALYGSLRDQGIGTVETRLRRSDGVFRDVIVTASPLRAEDLAVGTVVTIHDITERKRAEEELRLNEARLQGLVELLQHSAPSIQEFLDFALQKAIEMTDSRIGYIYFYHEDRREFVLNTWSKDVMKECAITDPMTCYALDRTGLWGEAVRQKRPIVVNDFDSSHPLRRGYPEGHAKLYRFMTVPVFSCGEIVAVVGVANKQKEYTETDVLQLTLLMDSVWKVTERKRSDEEREKLRDQLLHAQKMESVGRLAGGVAHDFNNMLGVIVGHTEIALRNMDTKHPLYAGLRETWKAAQRSADLTRQLLAFARKQTIVPKVLDLNETVEGMLKMLRRLIGRIST